MHEVKAYWIRRVSNLLLNWVAVVSILGRFSIVDLHPSEMFFFAGFWMLTLFAYWSKSRRVLYLQLVSKSGDTGFA